MNAVGTQVDLAQAYEASRSWRQVQSLKRFASERSIFSPADLRGTADLQWRKQRLLAELETFAEHHRTSETGRSETDAGTRIAVWYAIDVDSGCMARCRRTRTSRMDAGLGRSGSSDGLNDKIANLSPAADCLRRDSNWQRFRLRVVQTISKAVRHRY